MSARILVLGDLHGDLKAGLDAIKEAKRLGITLIMQCGDFGYWPHYKDGVEFLDGLNALLRQYDIRLVWVDGNHENFDQLERDIKYAPNDGHGRVFIRSHILWATRGSTWTWNKKRFLAVGGAVSVDRAYRTLGKSWWVQETITPGELAYVRQRVTRSQKMGKPIDYLFTHDCPTNAPFRGRLKNDPDSAAHRQVMDEVGKIARPKLWFHGHMHTKYDGYQFPTYESTSTVYGLECNPEAMHGYQTGAYWGVLDTDTDQFSYKTAS